MLRPEMKPVEGGSPSGGTPTKPKPKPKPEESHPDLPWYYAHIFPAPVPESPDEGEGPPVQQTLVNRPPVATRPQPTSIPDDILDYEREQEKRLGISPASQNDERSSSGSSQTKILADTNQANDESPVQEVLPDIAEGQDDFGTNAVFDGISPERLHAFSNLEFLRVKQDIERRPLTFKLAFEQHESPRSALEYVYAYPPDLDDETLIHISQGLGQGQDGASGGSSRDERTDVGETFTLDDVRQFTEIDLATETFDAADVAHYKKMLDDVFEYVIVFDDKYKYSPED